MRITNSLWKTLDIGRMIKKHWYIGKERKIKDYHVERLLVKYGIKVEDPLEPEKKPRERFVSEREPLDPIMAQKLRKVDKTFCLSFNNNNLLQEGIDQALVLTKTAQIANQLPEQITNLITPTSTEVDYLVQRSVWSALLFDAHQEKLPIRKDPLRPAWVYRRDYGITPIRKARNLSKKLLQLCECLNGVSVQHRIPLHAGETSFFIEKELDLLRFSLSMDLLLLSSKPLKQIQSKSLGLELELPNMSPMHHTISLTPMEVEEIEDKYPIDFESFWGHVHTLFVFHDPVEVKNLTELPVTESQLHSRSIMKSFTAAASCARHKFGMDIKDLPEPITIQCIQTDGQKFHFSVFQLNTLNLDGTDGIKNFWWSSNDMDMYETIDYVKGIPTLLGYNSQVFDTIYGFYKND